MFWSISTVALALAVCLPLSRGQDLATDLQSAAGGNSAEPNAGGSGSPDAALGKTYNSGGISSRGFMPYTLPDLFKGHWVGTFSAGEVRDNGILNGHFQNGASPNATFSDASAAFAYDLRQRNSDYLLDYRIGARHYSRYGQLDVLTHDLSLSQTTDFGAHTRWTLAYRYSMTPDLAGSLMAETLATQMAFINPVPKVAVAGLGGAQGLGFANPLPITSPGGSSVLQAPFQPVQTPADGLITLRSLRMTNASHAGLSHQLGYRTMLSFEAGFNRERFEDPNLFGSNQYSISAGITHLLTRRTSIGLSVGDARMDVSSVFDRTTSQGVSVVITRQLGLRSVISFQAGPAEIRSRGQQSILLPSLLGNLLGRPSLTRGATHSTLNWLGGATYLTNIHNVGFGLSYTRSVTDTGGLAGAALTQNGIVTLSKTFRERTILSVEASYGHYQMLGFVNPIKLDQEGLSVNFTRQLSPSLDFTSYFQYAKSLRGMQGPVLLDHNLVGVRVVYYFHRLSLPTGA